MEEWQTARGHYVHLHEHSCITVTIFEQFARRAVEKPDVVASMVSNTGKSPMLPPDQDHTSQIVQVLSQFRWVSSIITLHAPTWQEPIAQYFHGIRIEALLVSCGWTMASYHIPISGIHR